jgi:hypothetical protein
MLNGDSNANAVHVRRLLTGQLMCTLHIPSRVTYMLAVSNQSALLVTGHTDGQVHVLNVQHAGYRLPSIFVIFE